MIVRILHEGQYELAPDSMERLQTLDDRLMGALLKEDGNQYKEVLGSILALVRKGRLLADDELKESDLVVPAPDYSFDEARDLFKSAL